jgi:hypothetical protein
VTDNNFLGKQQHHIHEVIQTGRSGYLQPGGMRCDRHYQYFTEALKDLRESILFFRRGWEENP